MDTSALGKRYMAEIGSAWVVSVVNPFTGNTIAVSYITEVEVCSALSRKIRNSQISQQDAIKRQSDFLVDLEHQYITVSLNTAVRRYARDLLFKHPLRALDAIQLGSAIEFQSRITSPVIFVSADANLLNAASVEGFAVDNPLAHP
jgi:hypothetical protein